MSKSNNYNNYNYCALIIDSHLRFSFFFLQSLNIVSVNLNEYLNSKQLNYK